VCLAKLLGFTTKGCMRAYKGIYELRALVPNLETKNSEAQYFIKSFRSLLEGERIGKFFFRQMRFILG